MSLHREEHQNVLNQEKKTDEALGKVVKFQQHVPNVLCFYI